MAGMTIADALIALHPDWAGFNRDLSRGMAGVGDQADKAGARAGTRLVDAMGRSAGGSRLGDALTGPIRDGIGKAVTVGSALLGSFIGGSVEAFGAFQQRMNEVFTLLPDITGPEMAKMTDDVKAFSRETGRLPDEVIPALYQAISAGVPKENVFDFLRIANKGATSGVAQTKDEVLLLTAVTKGFGDTSLAAQQKAADLAQLMVKLGQTTIPELAASYGQAVPLANALGVSQEELAAASASLFGVTGNTSEVMTQQKAVLTALITQNPQLTKTLQEMGFATSEQAIKSLGLKGTLDGLVKTTGGSSQALQQMLGSAEAVTATLALTGAQSDTFASNLTAMGQSAGTVDTAFRRMDSGIAATGRKVFATVTTMALGIGERLQGVGPALLALNQGGQLFGISPAKLVGGAIGGIAGQVGKRLVPALLQAIGLSTAPAAAAAAASGAVAGAAEGTAQAAAVAAAGPAVAGAVASQTPEVATAAGAVGTAAGGEMAAATAAGFGARLATLATAGAFAVPVVLVVKGGADAAGNAASEVDEIQRAIASRSVEQMAALRAKLQAVLSRGPSLFGGPSTSEVAFAAQGLKALDAAMADAGQSAGDAFGATEMKAIRDSAAGAGAAVPVGLAAGAAKTQPIWDGKVDSIVAFFGTSMAGVVRAGRVAGADGMLAMAQGITDARKRPLDAFDTLKEMLKISMSPLKEAALLGGQLTSRELARGLKDGRPDVRAQALATLKEHTDRLKQLALAGGPAGKRAMQELGKGIHSKNPTVRKASLEAKRAVVEELDKARIPAGEAGANAGDAFAAALKKKVAEVLAGVIADIAKNPAKYADTAVGGAGGSSGHHAAGGLARAGEPSWFGEEGPELSVPAEDRWIFTHSQSMAIVGAQAAPTPAGRPIEVNVYNPVPEPASTSTRRELRKLALSGSAS